MRNHPKLGVIHKRLRIKIVDADGKSHLTVLRAGAGKCYTEANVDTILEQIAEGLEKNNPAQEYRLIEVGPGAFNFVFAGMRAPDFYADRQLDEGPVAFGIWPALKSLDA
jgi:hypothetical protein